MHTDHTMPRCDPQQIAAALRLILAPDQVTELRGLDAVAAADRRPHVESGYFDRDHIDALARAVASIPSAKGIYITPNPVAPALLARACNRLRAVGKDPTTSDRDVVARRWLLIDVDPLRPAGVSASDAEHDTALVLASTIKTDLTAAGWPLPIVADSGNGAHLMYRIDLPADDGGLVQRCLEALAAQYSTEALSVDRSVYNPSRIWKLYGTLACKGDSTPDRPHRMSRILHAPEAIGVVSVEALESLAASANARECTGGSAHFRLAAQRNGSLDVAEWLASHAVDASEPTPWQGGRKWVLAVCPWDASHSNGSAYIVQHASGAISAGCHHNSCRGRDWRALRDMVEHRQPASSSTPPAATSRAPAAKIDATRTPIVTCLADVEPRSVSWLWPGRIPLGRITLLVGRPGEGKSFFTSDAAARISTGTPWPDGSDCPRGSIILLSAEDDPGDTIRPRLDAHYADCRRIHLLSAVRRADAKGEYERIITLADVDAIEAVLRQIDDVRLIVVDPIGSYLGSGTDAHRDNEVRGVLAPIAALAERYGPAVLVVAHRRKSAGSSADDSALGSRAFTGIARAVWHLSRDPDSKSRRLLLPGKNNLAREGDGLAFAIVGEPARISWERDPVAMHADDAMAAESAARKPGPEAEAHDAATAWLRAALADGPRLAAGLYDEWINGHGGSKITLKRAKQSIGAEAYRPAVPGPWWWRSQGDQVQGDHVTKEKELEPLDTLANSAGFLPFSDPQNPKGIKLIDLEPLGPDDPTDDANAALAAAAGEWGEI